MSHNLSFFRFEFIKIRSSRLCPHHHFSIKNILLYTQPWRHETKTRYCLYPYIHYVSALHNYYEHGQSFVKLSDNIFPQWYRGNSCIITVSKRCLITMSYVELFSFGSFNRISSQRKKSRDLHHAHISGRFKHIRRLCYMHSFPNTS